LNNSSRPVTLSKAKGLLPRKLRFFANAQNDIMGLLAFFDTLYIARFDKSPDPC